MSYGERGGRGTIGWRMKALRIACATGFCIIALRLFFLQGVQAAWYRTQSESQHAISELLDADRGSIYVKDYGDDTEYTVATNQQRAFIFVDPRKILEPKNNAFAIAKVLQLDGWDKIVAEGDLPEVPEVTTTDVLIERLSKTDDAWEPVARDVTQDALAQILALKIPGIDYLLQGDREYPEEDFGGQVLGFVGSDDSGAKHGYYGVEGYFDDFLAGRAGTSYAESDATGRWIGVGVRSLTPAVDGGDILLTIDRTVQYMACKMLAEGVSKFQADSGALVIVEPQTGRILAMCGAPDFDPNDYGNVDDGIVYNNNAIFTPYEPGSIFKPITMAAAVDVGALSPNTTFEDTGSVQVDDYTIRNSDLKSHGLVTMTDVLDESLNTGMVWVMRKMGRDVLQDYILRFGFGTLSGIELSTEAPGDVTTLNESAEVYAATASFGQGITVTPLQIAMAYAAIANGGTLMQPQIVSEMRYPDGTVEERVPKAVRQVLTSKTATTLGAMLVSVVENGHGKRAGVSGYYIAGKTGTAQVAGRGGYLSGVSNGSFAGFGPVGNPRFAMVVKLENPKTVEWAESSAAPIFGEIADFLVDYYGIAPERPN